MSILICGMEMPTSCVNCRFHKSIYCTLTDICTNTAQRCPLVPIPPHGDLIERKAACLTDFEIVMCDGDYKDGMKMLLEKIESAPTIIPAEEGE